MPEIILSCFLALAALTLSLGNTVRSLPLRLIACGYLSAAALPWMLQLIAPDDIGNLAAIIRALSPTLLLGACAGFLVLPQPPSLRRSLSLALAAPLVVLPAFVVIILNCCC